MKTVVFETNDYRWAVSILGAMSQIDPSVKLGTKFASTNPAVLRLNSITTHSDDCIFLPLPETEEDFELIERQEFDRVQKERWALEGVIMEGPPGKLSVTHMGQTIARSLAPGKYTSLRPKTWYPTNAEVEGNDFDCVVDCAENIPYALAFLQGMGLTSPTIETCDGCTDEETIVKVLSPHVKLVVGPANWVGTYATYCTYRGFDLMYKSPAVLLVYPELANFDRFNVIWPSCNAIMPGMPGELCYIAGQEWIVRNKYRHDDIAYLRDVAKSKQNTEGVSDLSQPAGRSGTRSSRGKKPRRKSPVHSKG